MTIKVYNMNNPRIRNNANLKRDIKSLITNNRIYCHNKVTKEYLESAIQDKTDFLYISYNKYNVPTGFACVGKDYISPKSRFIHLICVQSYMHMRTRSNKRIPPIHLKGSDLLEHIKEDAIKARCHLIELQALDDVITYYYRYGYRFVTHCDRKEDPSIPKLVKDLYKSRNNPKKKERLLRSRYLTRFLPGRLAEDNLRMELNEDKIETLINDGYLMRLCLPLPRNKLSKKTKRKKRSTK